MKYWQPKVVLTCLKLLYNLIAGRYVGMYIFQGILWRTSDCWEREIWDLIQFKNE